MRRHYCHIWNRQHWTDSELAWTLSRIIWQQQVRVSLITATYLVGSDIRNFVTARWYTCRSCDTVVVWRRDHCQVDCKYFRHTAMTSCCCSLTPNSRQLHHFLFPKITTHTHLRAREHITDTPISLHWLRAPERILYKTYSIYFIYEISYKINKARDRLEFFLV